MLLSNTLGCAPATRLLDRSTRVTVPTGTPHQTLAIDRRRGAALVMGMGALKALHQCLQLACARAEQGSAFSPSGVRHLQHAVGRLQQDREPSSSCLQDGPHKGRAPWPGQLPGGGLASWAPALLGGKAAVGRGALGGTAARGPSLLLPLAAAAAQPHQLRGLFGARQPAEPPPQVHTHAAYKRENPQPTYE